MKSRWFVAYKIKTNHEIWAMPTVLNFVWGRSQYACVEKCIFEYTNMHQMCHRHLFWLSISHLQPFYSHYICCWLHLFFVCLFVRTLAMHWLFSFSYVQEYTGPGGAEVEVEKPAKDEYTIAKWIKKNVPTKKTKFLNHAVEYFTGKFAIILLAISNRLTCIYIFFSLYIE